MANEYLVNSEDMTAVAEAIRAKGGTSDALAFPGGFVGAIAASQTGSGGGVEVGSNNFPGSVSDMLNAIVSGTAKVGSFQLAKVLSSTERELVFDTGLDNITNLVLINDGFPKNYIQNYSGYGFALWDGGFISALSGAAEVGNGSMQFIGITQGFGLIANAGKGGYSRGWLYKEGGKVFGLNENNWNNATYTCLIPNVKYWWGLW